MSEYNLGTASGRITVDGSGAEKAFGVVLAAAQTFFDQINQEVDRVKNLGENLQKSALVGAAGFGVAVKAASGFENRLSAIQAVSGATTDEMAKISEAALRIGADTSFSATEAALAFEELIKAGISVEDALGGAADATAALAAAGEISLPRAAEIAASAMNNFNLTGADMPKIADAIAGAANASAISVDEFASSLSQVGAVANLSGLSFQDTAVAIAEMGNAGIKGSDAGTSLKTMLMNLIPTTDKQVGEFQRLGLMTYDAADAMEDMRSKGIEPLSDSYSHIRQAVSDYLEATEGIPDDTKEMGKAVDDYLLKNGAMQNAFFDQEGNVKSLRDIQEELNKSTKNLTKEQKLQSLEILFGADAIRGAAVMADNGAAGYDKLAESMGKVTAADVSSTRLDNLSGDIEALKGSLETLLIRIGTTVTPIFRAIVQGATEVVNWFNNLSDGTVRLLTQMGLVGTVGAGIIGTFIQILAAAGPLLFILIGLRRAFLGFSVVKKALSGVTGLRATFVALRGVAATLLKTLFPFIPWIMRAVSAFGILRAVVAGLAFVFTGPIGAALGIIAALVAIGTVLYNTWEPFRQVVDTIAAAISGVFTSALEGLRGAWETVVAGFQGSQGTLSGLAGFFQSVGAGARFLWDALTTGVQTIVANLLPALQGLWDQLAGAVGPALEQLGNTVATTLWPALQNLGNVIMTQVWPALQDLFTAVGPIIGVFLQIAGVLVGVLIFGLIQLATILFGHVIPAIINFAGPVLAGLITAIAAVAGFIIQYLITPFVDFISFLVGTVIPAIIQFGTELVNGFTEAFGSVIQWITEAWTAITTFFTDLVSGAQSAGSGASAGIGGFVESVVGFFTGLITSVQGFVATVGAALANFFQPLIDAFNMVMIVVTPVLTYLGSAFATVFTAIMGVIGAFINLLVKLGTFLYQLFVAGVQTTLNFFMIIVTTVFTAVSRFISTTMAAIQMVITTVWNSIVAFVTPILNTLSSIVSSVWNSITGFITGAMNRISSIINSVWNAIVGFLRPIITSIANFISARWNEIQARINAVMNVIRSVITSVWNAISSFINGVISTIRNYITSGFEAARSQVQGIVNGLRSGVEGGFNALMSFIGGIRDRVIGFFSGAGSWLLNAGRQIIDGLVSGIQGALGGLQGMLEDITGMIPDWKGPPKRDKVLLEPAGEMIMQSLVNGFRHGISDVYRTLNDLNTEIPLALTTDVPATVGVTNARVEAERMPVYPNNVTKDQNAPIPTGDNWNIKIEAKSEDEARKIVDKVMHEVNKIKRGGKFAGRT